MSFTQKLKTLAYFIVLSLVAIDLAGAQGGNPGVTAVSPRTALDIVQWNSNTQIVGQGKTFTASSPARIAQTWNNAGVTFTGALVNVTDTASAAASLLLNLQVGGNSVLSVGKTVGTALNFYETAGGQSVTLGGTPSGGITFSRGAITGSWTYPGDGRWQMVSSGYLGWVSSGSQAVGIIDLAIYRDAANTLAQRNGTNAQTFRLYGTFTDASNYERGSINWSGGVLRIATEGAGTGSSGSISLLPGSATYTFGNNNVVTLPAAAGINWVGRARLQSLATNTFSFLQSNAVQGDVTIQIGGSTSAFPALKRFGNAAAIRQADDTVGAFANLTACASDGEGALAVVTDSSTATWGATVTGGGANRVLAYCNGTNWTVAGI